MTKQNKLLDALQDSPIIAAVKNDEGLCDALKSECAAVFFLYGSICNIACLVEQVRQVGKLAIVHVDLIDGLASREVAADFLCDNTHADGIISTRPNLIRRGRERGLIAIQRFFLLDSLSFENVQPQAKGADMVDILPGTMPKTIRRLAERIRQPIIASGLLANKEDIMAALGAGAVAVSTTSPSLWFL